MGIRTTKLGRSFSPSTQRRAILGWIFAQKRAVTTRKNCANMWNTWYFVMFHVVLKSENGCQHTLKAVGNIFKPSKHLEASTHPIYLTTGDVDSSSSGQILEAMNGTREPPKIRSNIQKHHRKGTRVATNVCGQSCKHLIMFLYLILSRGNVINPFCYTIFKQQTISLLLIHNTQQLFPLGNVQWSFGPFHALGKGCYRPTIMIHGAVSTIRQI